MRRLLLVALVAAVAVPLTTTPSGAGEAAEPRPVETFTRTFIDEDRDRTLVTTVTYRADTKKRLPLIVLAHGNDGHPDKFKILMNEWATAGYIVAAPAFPLTNDAAPGPSQSGDVANQPADVSFVIDELLKLNRKSSHTALAGRIDKKRIGVAGLSLGGATTYGVVFHSCCLDKRVDAAIVMSGIRFDFEGGEFDFRDLPTMLVHGDADSIYGVSQDTYPLLGAPKWFVTLHGSTHSAPFEDSTDPADELVPVITTAFFDRYLKGRKAAEKRLVEAVEDYGQAELVRER